MAAPDSSQQLAEALRAALGELVEAVIEAYGEVTLEVAPDRLVEVATRLRDDDAFRFQQLSDVCGVDYSQFGRDDWHTEDRWPRALWTTRGTLANVIPRRNQHPEQIRCQPPSPAA